jgi:hypothetical protein
MRWVLIALVAWVGMANAQQPTPRTPPPPGVEIPARDGDRIIVDDDARIQIVRRRQGTVRTIFNQEQRLLIVLVDYVKPGEFPDGLVDEAMNFFEVEGDWPLGARWEMLTTMFRYEGDPPSRSYGISTPQGLVQLSPSRPEALQPEPAATAVLWFRGSSVSLQRRMSFAEAEKALLAEAAKRRSGGGTNVTIGAKPAP